MKWKKYTIETTTAAEEFMSAMLMELGIEGIEIEDNVPLSREDQADMFIDFLPELPADEGISHVSFYIEDDGSDQSELLKRIKCAFEKLRDTVEAGTGIITSSETEDLDWINNWKQYFSSFTVGGILIKPTWEELKTADQDKLLIEIDPGISFGTGKHETTQLCIRQLIKHMKSLKAPKVLDVGCGSGILSIAALKLGARAVVGTDLDRDCMISTRNNMQVNHLDASLGTFYVGNLIDDRELQEKVGSDYEIVVANILADVIIPMAPVVFDRLKAGGLFITSGIIDFKEQEVRAALEAAGFAVTEINHQGEWVNITARRE
ncbi:MAG: 50S ribosomal protein L11 methyltransferase [Roseburia sp.]|nr:50S ribosomal protein L11 methyltransferase [Roseburia sp.]MCM1431305.1 50S ribosomal protein L11 methyltransferase [Muribaculaceae bacterium]